ncbi:hypothetical protein C0033_03260 [Clostridium sp. chh4-2]|uniref:tripartite tricarboxylate transporter TctB family protein n=1 Tax=Clostridium sp. chh4-2 TaxID=2067550 RepID=UPI000CCECCC0|nr:tripartite tricarboxylate transporter TctB family protein [Clostridium sp. chh4-2]PNV63680.1 hypothetical protein C0033_03260 [Clostridium sp. chh4-2]
MTKDRVTGLIALVLGCAVAAAAAVLPPSTMAGDIGPKAFPYISAGILILCGGGLFITGGKKSPVYYTKEQLGRLAMIFGVVLCYVIVMHYLGYRIATVAALYILCTMFSRGKDIHLWKRLAFSIILTAVLYFVFTKMFAIPLPGGQLL